MQGIDGRKRGENVVLYGPDAPLDTLFMMTLDTGEEVIEHPTSCRPLASLNSITEVIAVNAVGNQSSPALAIAPPDRCS